MPRRNAQEPAPPRSSVRDAGASLPAAERPVAAITGATGAIGAAIARQLAERGYVPVLVVRNRSKAEAVLRAIEADYPGRGGRCEIADLARAAEVAALGARWPGRLDVLVNCAATAPRRRQQTPEGLELQFATNVLGYLWMTQALRPALAAAPAAHVINVASYWAGGLDVGDLQFVRRRYDNDAAYRQSKQANRMLTVAWAERLRGDGIRINACHPGDVASTLSHDLGFGGSQSADQGAATPVALACGELGAGVTGGYFEHGRQTPCHFSRDAAAVAALDAACGHFLV